MREMRSVRHVAAVVALLLAPTIALGSGFALFEHGARGVAMGGAFGATANDPTALYYNPAGLAFLEGTQVAAGAYFITLASDFKGANPYPGASYKASQKSQIFYPPHIYATGALSGNLRWGIGLNAPFGLGTWWEDDFAGKFITKRTDLKIFNLNPTLAYKISDSFSIALGADYFITNVDLTRSIPAVNPFTQQVAEVGQVHMYTRQQTGLGWNVAMLGHLGGGFSAGLAYRSKVKVDMEGKASFVQFRTGYADFDTIVATQIPFNENPTAKTGIDFPDEVRVAFAWHNDVWRVEADWVRMGWSSFKELPITLPKYPQLSSVRPENYQDSRTYRLGFEYGGGKAWAWQLGFLYDESPVPTETVSPILPDAKRTGISIGFSKNLSPNTRFDVGFLHLIFPERSTEGRDGDNFNGKYSNGAELLGFSLVHRF